MNKYILTFEGYSEANIRRRERRLKRKNRPFRSVIVSPDPINNQALNIPIAKEGI